MRENVSSGLLITFCGLDGCGKTTMLRRLEKEMGDVFVTKQPTNAVRNSEIFRTYTDSPDHSRFDYRSLSLLAASDRLQHVEKVVLPRLEKGETVLSDRYFYSCLANLRARGYVSDKWIYEIGDCMVRPDVAFFFDVSVPIAVGRVRRRPEEKDRYIDMSLQYALREEYRKICDEYGGVLINTEKSEDECFFEVLAAVKRAATEKKTLSFLRLLSEKRSVLRSDRLVEDLCVSPDAVRRELSLSNGVILETVGDVCDAVCSGTK